MSASDPGAPFVRLGICIPNFGSLFLVVACAPGRFGQPSHPSSRPAPTVQLDSTELRWAAMDYFKELQGFADRIRSIEPGNYFSRLYQV